MPPSLPDAGQPEAGSPDMHLASCSGKEGISPQPTRKSARLHGPPLRDAHKDVEIAPSPLAPGLLQHATSLLQLTVLTQVASDRVGPLPLNFDLPHPATPPTIAPAGKENRPA